MIQIQLKCIYIAVYFVNYLYDGRTKYKGMNSLRYALQNFIFVYRNVIEFFFSRSFKLKTKVLLNSFNANRKDIKCP